jgi:hypothetical protein
VYVYLYAYISNKHGDTYIMTTGTISYNHLVLIWFSLFHELLRKWWKHGFTHQSRAWPSRIVWGVHRRNKAEQHMWYIKLQSFTYHNMSQVNNLYICSYANRLEIETNDSRQVYVHIQSLYVTIYIFLKKKSSHFGNIACIIMYHHVS